MRIPALAVAALLATAGGAASAAVPRTVVVGAQRDADGFNVATSCCGNPWDSWMGAEEALRGAFVRTPKGRWVVQLVSAASADGRGITYTIKDDAFWYWGGRKVPVTYRDFVYTLRQIDDPTNQVANHAGYANLDPRRFTHRGERSVTFFWRTSGCTADTPCAPYGAWRRLFSTLYPSFALRGLDFDTMWSSCICGDDGKPVSDGPYYLASYAKGMGSVLRRNPFWAGPRPAIAEIDFRVLPDTASEEQAMASGTVDAIAPTFGQYLEPLKNAAGLTFSEVPGYYLEHLVFREGAGATNALLRAPFMRAAVSLAIDRTAIIDAIFGGLAAGTTPAESALYYPGEAGYVPDFKRWDYNPKRAVALLARHCTGGPAAPDPGNTATWQCSALPATFTWTWPSGDIVRTVIEAVAKAELRAVGIQVVDRPLEPDAFYGSAGIESGSFDIADYAETTGGDPGDWSDDYACAGAANVAGFCSRTVSRLLAAAARATGEAARARDLRRADAALAGSVPILPLYAQPAVLVHKAAVLGLANNPGPAGPFWNVEDWRWRP